MKHLLFTSLLLLFLSSCNNGNEKSERVLIDCFRNSSKDYNGGNIDLLTILINVEAVFIEEKMVGIGDKSTYIKLYKKVTEGKINDERILEKISEKVPLSYLITVPNNFLSNIECFDYVIKNTPLSDTNSVLCKEHKKLKYIFEQGDSSLRQYEELINSIDKKEFNKPIYRMPLIALLYSQIEYNSQRNTR